MKSRARGSVVGLVSLIGAVVLFVELLPPLLPRQSQPCPLYEDVQVLRFALAMYRADYDAFPYDSRGPGYALRKLRPYLQRLPTVLPDGLWLRDRVKLEDTGIHYANERERMESPASQGKNCSDLLLWFPAGDGRLKIGADLSIIYEPAP